MDGWQRSTISNRCFDMAHGLSEELSKGMIILVETWYENLELKVDIQNLFAELHMVNDVKSTLISGNNTWKLHLFSLNWNRHLGVVIETYTGQPTLVCCLWSSLLYNTGCYMHSWHGTSCTNSSTGLPRLSTWNAIEVTKYLHFACFREYINWER